METAVSVPLRPTTPRSYNLGMTALPAPRDNDSRSFPAGRRRPTSARPWSSPGVRMQLPHNGLALAMTVAPVRMQPGRERTQQGALAHDAAEPPRSPPAPPPPVEADSRPASRRGWSTPRRPVTPRSAAPVLQLPPSPRAGSGPQLEVSPRSGRPCSGSPHSRPSSARLRTQTAGASPPRPASGLRRSPPPEPAAAADEPVVLTERRSPSTASAAFYPYASSYQFPTSAPPYGNRSPPSSPSAVRGGAAASPEAAAAAAARACSPPPQPTAAKSAAAAAAAHRGTPGAPGAGFLGVAGIGPWNDGGVVPPPTVAASSSPPPRNVLRGSVVRGSPRGAPACRSAAAAAVPSFAALGGAVGIGGATDRLALSVAYSSGGGRLRAF